MTQLTEMNANKNRHIFPLTESIHHMCSVLMTDAEQLQALNQQLLSNRPCQQTRNQREPQKDPWAARLTDTFRQEVAAEWILNTAALERDWTRLSPNGPHLSEADARTSRELHAGISHTALPSGKTKPSVHLKWSENNHENHFVFLWWWDHRSHFSATSLNQNSCDCDPVWITALIKCWRVLKACNTSNAFQFIKSISSDRQNVLQNAQWLQIRTAFSKYFIV